MVVLFPDVKGVSEKIEQGCRKLGVKAIFKSRHTIRDSLVKVKDVRPDDMKKGVVYEVPYSECRKVDVGETGWNPQRTRGDKGIQVCNEEWYSCTSLDSTTCSRLVISPSKNH